jgi:hypothetical protein
MTLGVLAFECACGFKVVGPQTIEVMDNHITNECELKPRVAYSRNQCQFTKEELSALYQVLEREWIPYDNELAHQAIRKIWKIINEKLD